MLTFALESGGGPVAALLNIGSGAKLYAADADAIRIALKNVMDVFSWNISVYQRYHWTRQRYPTHPRYDECYHELIRDRGIPDEIRSRFIRRQDTDDLAENQPIPDRLSDFYARRKAWKYRYSIHKEDNEPGGGSVVSFSLRRSGTHPRHITVGQSIYFPE